MIEDVELTRKILEYFAQEDIGFPANVTLEELCGIFNDRNEDEISYHLVCAEESGLLTADYTVTKTFDGHILTFGYISGLTAQGGDYVRYSQSHWGQALQVLREKKVAVTREILTELLPALAKQVLGIN